MKSFIHKSLFCACLFAFMVAARPSAAQLPAFHSKSNQMCLPRHHFKEQELLLRTKKTWPEGKNRLNSDGNGVGWFAWKTLSHPNVGQGINLGFSLPTTIGVSWKPKEMFGSTFPGSERIGNFLNGFGAVLIMGQLVEDIATDNPQLQINLGKNTAYWTIGATKLFSKTMQISSIAIQVFDYTLNELGNAAINGQKHLWYNAYKNFFDHEYGHHVSDMHKWDALIAKHGGDMNQALLNMHKEFWGAHFRDSYKEQKYIWGNAEPSETVKFEIRDTYLQEIIPVLTNYYHVQRQKARAAAVRKANSMYNDMVDFMEREIVFRGTVTSAAGRPLAGVKISLFGTHPVLSNEQGEYREVFRMCELIPELGKSNNKILATAYYTPDPAKPTRTQPLSRGLGVGFMSQADQIDSIQDRLDFVFKTDDWVELTIRPQNAELDADAITNLTAICRKDDGTQMVVTHEVEWHSDKPGVATVADGKVTAQKSKGIANITAYSVKPGRDLTSAPCQVAVKFDRQVDQLSIQPSKIDIKSNGLAPIKAVALFNDGTVKNVTIDPECKWTSVSTNLTVTPQGKLQAGKAIWGKPDHKLTATYTFKGKTVAAQIPVRLLSVEKATALKINKPEVTMGLKENVGLRVTALIGMGTATYPVDVTTQVVWTVSDKALITQTAGGVIVSGNKEGYCGVKAEFRQPNGPPLQVLCKVTVVDKNRPLPAPDFSIAPKEDPHLVGERITFCSLLPATTGPMELTWFLDGKEIKDRSEVTHPFASPGTYTIRFFVHDPVTGKSDAAVKTIHVETPPEEAVTIGFKPETNIYAIGDTVEFLATANKLNPQTKYRWHVAGEFIGEGAQGVTHQFMEDGEFDIKLGLRRGSNFDEEKIFRTLTVGKAGIGTLGRLRNRFVPKGGNANLEIQSQYYRGGSGDWSELIRFNGGHIGPVDHYILYDGDQQDGWNTGFLFYVPAGQNELRYKLFHFRWPSNPKIGPSPRGIVHVSGLLDLHGKNLVPDSVNFARKASRLCIVEWRTEDGSSCRARIGKFKKTNQDAMSGVKNLGCEEGAYPPIEDTVEIPPPNDSGKDDDTTDGDDSGGAFDSKDGHADDDEPIEDDTIGAGGPGSGTTDFEGDPDGESGGIPLPNDSTGSGAGAGGGSSGIKLTGEDGGGSSDDTGGSGGGRTDGKDNTENGPDSNDGKAGSSGTDIEETATGTDTLAGLWIANDGQYLHIYKNGEWWEVTALENKGPVGWKKATTGRFDGQRFSLLINSRVHFADVTHDGARIDWGKGNYWALVDPSPTAQDIDEHTFHPFNLAGFWICDDGQHIRISQSEDKVTATPLENKGPVGWKTGGGKVYFWDVYLLLNSRIHSAKISEDGNRITWGPGRYWVRNSTAGGEESQRIENQKKNAGGIPGSVSGNWTIHQSNGFTGKADFFQDSSGGLTGEVNWGTLKGRLTGKLSGTAVKFTLQYPDGLKGHYTGTLSADGTQILNGASTSSTGDSATWTASRPSAPKTQPAILRYGRKK